MDIYEQIAVKIIAGQESIIGPVAIEQAQQVSSLQLDWANHTSSISGTNKVSVIDELIQRYKDLFGHISVEVSREAAGTLMTQLPSGVLPEAFK